MDAIITLAILVGVITTLIATRVPADVALMCAVLLLLLLDILQPTEALMGFSNPGVLTIATLYIVAAGLRETGAVQWLAHFFMGSPSSVRSAQLRILLPTAALSAFTNNTTVVAMFIPAIQAWGQRLNISASKLLIPLSYSAILGGTCTLIGTSTNLVVYGQLQATFDMQLGLFDIAQVGIPLVFVGALFLYLFGDRLLPDRSASKDPLDELRQYCVECSVLDAGPLAGLSILEAGLRNLNSGYLIEINRDTELYTAVEPTWRLKANDTLVFIGAPELANELRAISGLVPESNQTKKLNIKNHQRCIVEVVLGHEFPALGLSVRQAKFRSRFNAAILSVYRGGERQPGKLGDVILRVGDTLLIETSREFVEQYRFRKDFLLVSRLNDAELPDTTKAPLAIGITSAMIVFTVTGVTTILESALLAAGALVATGCISTSKARRHIDLQVLVVIAASFALGAAMKQTGAAELIASLALPEAFHHPWIALIVVYALTVLFTEAMTNNAAAVLMFPIAETYSAQLDANILPFAMAIMIAASASFMTPLGYQTNLMVFGPGQYTYTDYIKVGLPLSLLVACLSLVMIPFFWAL